MSGGLRPQRKLSAEDVARMRAEWLKHFGTHTRVRILHDTPRFLTDRDPGDETE